MMSALGPAKLDMFERALITAHIHLGGERSHQPSPPVQGHLHKKLSLQDIANLIFHILALDGRGHHVHMGVSMAMGVPQ